MNIRKMTIDDYEQVYDIWLKSGNGLNDVNDSKSGIEKYLKRNPNTCFVAEDGGKIIGSIMSGHDGRKGYISHTSVIASERKKGIGTLLVNTAIDALKSEGIARVFLLAFTHNEKANQFWEKLNFLTRHDIFYREKELTEVKRINQEEIT